MPKSNRNLPSRVELRDARAVVPVGHVEAPVGQPRHERRTVEVGAVGAWNVRRADRLHELLAVVGELVDRVRVVVDHPHVLLRVVGADVDRVRTLEQLVPLRPLLDDVALRVDDDEAVLPAGVDAELAIRRRRASPDLHPLRRVLTRSAAPWRRRRVRVAPRQSRERKLHVRTDLGKQPRLRTRDLRQLAAAEQIHAIRALGEDAARAAIRPLLVAGERAEILRPPFDHLVRARDVLRADGVRHGGERRAGAAAAGAAADGISRPPSGMPAARPTTSANAAAAVLLMPSSAQDYTATRAAIARLKMSNGSSERYDPPDHRRQPAPFSRVRATGMNHAEND